MAAEAADGNLLFGLLALQNGLIQQAQLVAAFHAWTCDKAHLLAEHLVALGHLSAAQRAAIEALAALHVEKHDGDVEKSLAAIPAGHSTREKLATLGDPQVEASLVHVGSASTEHDGDAGLDRTATYSVGTATSDGQRFRLLRPHARGGLGAVFVALDEELHREVALKQMLDQHADDPVSRSRFILEAEITGGLEHPGIVPVYGLGSYGNGRPFYAMRFIRGDSLKEAIQHFHGDGALANDPGRRSLGLRKLLRRFTDVCNAIEYAHSRGVLHRDIKPGNVIVGKHGETLMVDWGLAKARGKGDAVEPTEERTLMPSSASGSAETLPGSALGTPAYMSPEQARGDLEALGPRSDVYSLGATLYCLLTGKPPFEEDDIGEVLRRVQAGDFPPPRRLDPTIDRALEAICLKAMANKPVDRYASCRGLAEDVERWMADEPVAAWREPWTRTLLRWLTRHRTGVTGAAAAVLAGVVGLVAVLAVQTSANARLSASLTRETEAKNDLAAANAQLTRSKADVQARYDLAVDAIKTFHTGVSEDFLLKQDQFRELRDLLLKSASDFYGKLSTLLGKETGFASRLSLAQSNFELAEITSKVGRKEDALKAHRAVLAAREALAAESPANAAAKVDVGRSLSEVGWLLETTGQTDEALATYRRSESHLASVADSDPAARSALAASRARLGYLLSRTGNPEAALAAYKLAKADQEAVATAPGASSEARSALATTISAMGVLLSQTDRPSEGEAEHRQALALRQKLADDNPAVTEFRSQLARNHISFGVLLRGTQRGTEAEAEFRAALAISQKLADDNPAVTEFRSRLVDSHYGLGLLLADMGRLPEAEAEFVRALALQRKLAAENPSVTQFRSRQADAHKNLGTVLSQRGRLSEAEAEYRQALALYQKLADDNPGVPEHRRGMTRCLNEIGDLLTEAGHPSQAIDVFVRARDLLEALVTSNPSVTDYRNGLAFSLTGLGRARRRTGAAAPAATDLRRAIALRAGLAKSSYEARYDLALSHALLAGLPAEAGAGLWPAEGQVEADRAVAVLRRLVAEGYHNPKAGTDPDLDPLRSRPDFQALLMDLTFPSDPFAR
jgi:serine/threonine-protein kinase